MDDGKLEVGWQFTGLTPPVSQASRPTASTPQRPGASLLPAKWLAANIAYMRDLDYLHARKATALDPKAGAPTPAPPTPAPKASPKGRGRGGGRGGGGEEAPPAA